jgi:hypothetical protein
MSCAVLRDVLIQLVFKLETGNSRPSGLVNDPPYLVPLLVEIEKA